MNILAQTTQNADGLTITIPPGIPSIIGWVVIVVGCFVVGLMLLEFIFGLFYKGN